METVVVWWQHGWLRALFWVPDFSYVLTWWERLGALRSLYSKVLFRPWRLGSNIGVLRRHKHLDQSTKETRGGETYVYESILPLVVPPPAPVVFNQAVH